MYNQGEDLSPSNIRKSFGKLRGACEQYFESVGKALKAASIPDNVIKNGQKHPPKEILENLYITKRLTTKEIGHLYDVSRKVVLRWLKECEIPIRSPYEKKINDEAKNIIIQMYLSGISREEIGKAFNCGRETIRKILVNEGILERILA